MSYIGFVKHTFSSKIATLFIGIISHVLCTKAMGPSIYGIAILILVFQPIIIKFMNLGIAGSATYYINKDPNNKSEYIGTLLCFCIFSILPITIFLFFSLNFLFSIYPILIGYKNYLVYLFFLTPIFIFQFFLKNLLKALNQISTINNINILFISIFNFISFVLLYIFYKIDLNTFLSVQVLSTLISCILILIKLHKENNLFFSFNISFFKNMLNFGLKGYFANISGALNEKIETLIIGIFLSPAMIGNYSVALTISNKFKIIPQSLSLPLYPHLAKSNNKDAANQVNKIIRLTMFPFILIVCVSIFPIQLYLSYFYPQYLYSQTPMLILIFNVLFITIYKILGNYFLGSGRPELRSLQKIIFLFLNIMLMFYLVPLKDTWYGGVNGCAISVLLSGILVAFFSIIIYLRISKTNLRELIFDTAEFINFFNKKILKR